MDIKEAYLAMQAASGIEVGDTVKVLRKAETREMGWSNGWSLGMNAAVGKTFVVSAIADNGVELSGTGTHLDYKFPFFVLEIVKKGASPIDIGEYSVEFADDGSSIEVGCQTVDFDTVKRVYKRMKKARRGDKSRYGDLWNDVSDRYEWMATDKDGSIFAYINSPKISYHIDNTQWVLSSITDDPTPIKDAGTECPDWRESLERRPGK